MKVILNKCFGGFRPSAEAYRLYAKKKGIKLFPYEANGFNDYQKTTWDKAQESGSMLTMYFTKDFGTRTAGSEGCGDYHFSLREESREDPILIEVVEELGKRASSCVSNLVVVKIPDGMDYMIDDYDGMETLHEKVRVW